MLGSGWGLPWGWERPGAARLALGFVEHGVFGTVSLLDSEGRLLVHLQRWSEGEFALWLLVGEYFPHNISVGDRAVCVSPAAAGLTFLLEIVLQPLGSRASGIENLSDTRYQPSASLCWVIFPVWSQQGTAAPRAAGPGVTAPSCWVPLAPLAVLGPSGCIQLSPAGLKPVMCGQCF